MQHRPPWVEGTQCNHCPRVFTWFHRKHHCRACGALLCSKCSSKRHAVPALAFLSKVRVCDPCYERLFSASRTSEERLRHRDRVRYELLNTERDYVRDLRAVLEVYLRPLLRSAAGVTYEEVESLSANMETLCELHVSLLERLEGVCELEDGDFSEDEDDEETAGRKCRARAKKREAKRVEEIAMIDVLVNDFLPRMRELYLRFVSGFAEFQATYDEAKQRESFRAFLKEAQRDPAARNLSLEAFFIMPIQRLPRYELLLRDYRQHMSRDDIQHAIEYTATLDGALERLHELAMEVNERKRFVEGLDRLSAVVCEGYGDQLPLVVPVSEDGDEVMLGRRRPKGNGMALLDGYRLLVFFETDVEVRSSLSRHPNKWKKCDIFAFDDSLLWASAASTVAASSHHASRKKGLLALNARTRVEHVGPVDGDPSRFSFKLAGFLRDPWAKAAAKAAGKHRVTPSVSQSTASSSRSSSEPASPTSTSRSANPEAANVAELVYVDFVEIAMPAHRSAACEQVLGWIGDIIEARTQLAQQRRQSRQLGGGVAHQDRLRVHSLITERIEDVKGSIAVIEEEYEEG